MVLVQVMTGGLLLGAIYALFSSGLILLSSLLLRPGGGRPIHCRDAAPDR